MSTSSIELPKLRVDLNPADVLVWVDPREKKPYHGRPLTFELHSLCTADYALAACPDLLRIERKELSDFVACCGPERERFMREMTRMKAFAIPIVLVEATWEEIAAGEWRSSTTPTSVMGTAIGLGAKSCAKRFCTQQRGDDGARHANGSMRFARRFTQMTSATARAERSAKLCDADEIRRAWRIYIPPGQVTELRALNATVAGDNYPRTYLGYFDECEAFIESAMRLRSASGVYFVPNVINPDVLFRCANKIRAAGKDESGTTNNEIIARRWLLIDCDPKRPRGISATDNEHESAVELGYRIRAELSAEGWSEPIIASSGNGAHVTFRIDLPADDGEVVKRCLLALDQRFSTPEVSVDTTVHNAARIWKLPGSMAANGDNSTQRPWRMARILEAPQW